MQKLTVVISGIPDELMDRLWKGGDFVNKMVGGTELQPTETVYLNISDIMKDPFKRALYGQRVNDLLTTALGIYMVESTSEREKKKES